MRMLSLLSLAALLFLSPLAAPVAQAQDDAPASIAATPAEAGAADEEPAAAEAPATVDRVPRLTRGDVATWLDGFMPYAIARADIPGAVVVVVKDGAILYQAGYGYADLEQRTPVDPATTLFRPGSVSKLVTWTAVMQLVEQGQVDLDADINQYLDFEIPPYHGEPVTLRNVMTHTSGLEEKMKRLITSDPDDTVSLEAYVKHLPKRIFAPGTTPSYSNFATSLAGYVVERVSGQSFDDYMDEHLFGPLQMDYATFRQPLPERLQPHMARGYRSGSREPQKFEYVVPAPAGSMSASAEAMAHFMIAHLQQGEYRGRRILQPATAERMHTEALTILPPLHRMVLGFYEEDINGHRIIGHGGDTRWFHSDLHLFPDHDIGFFISLNSGGARGASRPLREALLREFVDRYLPGPAPDGEVDADTAREHGQQLAGLYQNTRREERSFMALLNLLGQTRVGVDEDGVVVLPSVTGVGDQPIRWREIAPWVWRDVDTGNRLAAEVVDGQVQRFAIEPYSPFMVFDRVPWWQSAAWLSPLLLLALTILLLTLLAWPISAMVRRYYRTPYGLSGRAARAHRLIRWTVLIELAVVFGIIGTTQMMLGNLDQLSARHDWLVHLLRLAALVVFPLAALAAAWNAWAVLGDRRRWTAKLWSVLLLVACLAVLWAACAFGFPGYSAEY